MKRRCIKLMQLMLVLLMTGCTQPANVPEALDPPVAEAAAVQPEAALPENVNEAGRIPVLMYHRIVESKSDYDRTPELFKSDLELLYQAGYRPISLKDFVAGVIDVPAGCSPVVITFDDGDRTQYTAGDNGPAPTADCALGIMEAFRAQHPDFNPQATFFVNGGVPFGQKQLLADKMNYLDTRGYTIGNHTWTHAKLSKLTPEEIQTELGRNAAALEHATGQPVELLALPYGIRPKEDALMAAVIAGSYEGKAYRHSGICNVGWQPELPAYMADFNPMAINRIRCGDDRDEAGDWLRRMEETPGMRYISDGDPATVTVPAEMAEAVNRSALGAKTLRILK